MDLGPLIQAFLVSIFGVFTVALAAVIGPTYDGLVVPELQASQLFPSVTAPGPGDPIYLAQAAHFSSYLLVNVVDPLIALVAIGLGLLYLLKAVWTRTGPWAEDLIARFVIAVILANFAVPVASGLLGVSGAMYPTVAGWDGGAWQHWVNLAGWGEGPFLWSNGALAFVMAFVEFSLVILLGLVIALRDAMLAVLLVLLPLFTILWPLRPLSPLARRGWLLFGELAFLPCVLVVPLELAVGSPNVLMLVAYLTLALASPYFLSLAGTQLSSFGFPSAGASLSNAVQRGLASAPQAPGGAVRSFGGAGGAGAAGALRTGLDGGARALGASTLPASAPALLAHALGQGASHLVRHVRGALTEKPGFDPVQRGGGE